MCSINRIRRYELIEIQVKTGSTGQINFPSAISTLQDNPERKIVITGMEIFPIYVQANSVKYNALTGLPVSEIPKFGVTLYYQGADFIRNIPAARFIQTVPPGNVDSPYSRQPILFDDIYPVMIDQCFVQFNSAAASNYVIPVGVTYYAIPVKAI